MTSLSEFPLNKIVLKISNGTTTKQNTQGRGYKVSRIETISDGDINPDRVRYVQLSDDELKKWRIKLGDILVSHINSVDHIGKSAIFDGSPETLIHGMNLLLLRPDIAKVYPEYLAYFLKTDSARNFIRSRCKRAINQASINQRELGALPVPLPSLCEQRRIVGILNRVTKIERLRAKAEERLREFIPALFIKMFGDPVENPHGHHQQMLSECANFISGATPSKRNELYWEGEIPWISPKDMKVDVISDSEDHVSKSAFADTNLKAVPANTSLIVVRGMILAHTVPIALTARTVAINQDMKAIQFDSAINPVFGFWCLKVLQQRILDDVDTAAHGTKRIEMSRLGDIPIHIPSSDQQRKYVRLVEKARTTIAVADSCSRTVSELTSCLMSNLLADDR